MAALLTPVLALLVLVGLASGAPVMAAPNCADVLFLGARGSGQPGPGSTGGWHPTAADPQGVGSTVRASLTRFRSALAGRRSVAVAAVDYPAAPVTASALLGHDDGYWSGLERGISDARSTLRRQADACPDQRFVLAGYSQGAMVMHRLLRRLESREPDLLGRVDAAILIGDGDRVAGDRTTKYGSMHRSGSGVGLSPLVVASSGSSGAKLSGSVGRRVLEVCNSNDVVCDFPGQSFAAHRSYRSSKALGRAASRAARLVLNRG